MPASHPQILLLEQFLPYRLNRAAEVISQEFSASYRDQYGMTRPEWRCLATIGQFGRVTASAIGQHSAMHKTKVSRAVSALEARRWVKRLADETDRRLEHLELTPAGRKAYQDLAAVALRYHQQLLDALGGQGRPLLAALAAIERRAP
jgi:DNA-binding MarR family transcriptional regulator